MSMFVARYTKQFIIAAAVLFTGAAGTVGVLGLPLGIDFTGGALTEVSYTQQPQQEVVEAALLPLSLGGFSLRQTVTDAGREGFILRTRDLSEEERQLVNRAVSGVGEGAVIERFTSIGPVIGQELAGKALWAIAGVVLIIILYVAFAFRGISYPVSSWAYGGITIVALLHDVLVPVAFFSLLALITGAEADVLFVMALLAVLGYSVNDTIVVFDRVRENLLKYRQEKKTKRTTDTGEVEVVQYTLTKAFSAIVGEAVDGTITRSVNTSVTTLIALCALLVLGGETTETFALMLMAGVIAGTYSSLCIANPLLIAIADHSDTKKA